MKRTIKEYVEFKTFEEKALFDDFKDSIGGRCFNKDSVYRWVYKLTDIKPTDDEIYEIMDKWVENKWAYKKENERTGANFYYFDLKETVSESKKILKEENENEIKDIKLIDTFEPKHEISEIGYFGYGTWYDAKYFSKNNSDGWRLPYDTEMKELAKINSDKFKEITGNNLVWMWTATEDVSLSGELDKAVGVNNTGNKGSGYKDEMHNIFLVR